MRNLKSWVSARSSVANWWRCIQSGLRQQTPWGKRDLVLTNLCPHILPHTMKLLIERRNLESRLSQNMHSPTDLVPGFLPMVIPVILLLKKTPFQWTTVTPGAFNHHDVAFTYLCPILLRLSTWSQTLCEIKLLKPNSWSCLITTKAHKFVFCFFSSNLQRHIIHLEERIFSFQHYLKNGNILRTTLDHIPQSQMFEVCEVSRIPSMSLDTVLFHSDL